MSRVRFCITLLACPHENFDSGANKKNIQYLHMTQKKNKKWMWKVLQAHWINMHRRNKYKWNYVYNTWKNENKKEMSYPEWASESELARSTRRNGNNKNTTIKEKKNWLNYLRTFTTAKSTRTRKFMCNSQVKHRSEKFLVYFLFGLSPSMCVVVEELMYLNLSKSNDSTIVFDLDEKCILHSQNECVVEK